MLRPDPSGCELTLTQVHPGVTVDDVREATGWTLRVADELGQTEPPTPEELGVLRELKATLGAAGMTDRERRIESGPTGDDRGAAGIPARERGPALPPSRLPRHAHARARAAR